LLLKEAKYPTKNRRRKRRNLRAMLTVFWRQGVVRKTRWRFWYYLWKMSRLNPGGLGSYLSTCAHGEHFVVYRQRVRDEITRQLERHLTIHEAVASDPATAASMSISDSSARLDATLIAS
jgi:hypothetical protein